MPEPTPIDVPDRHEDGLRAEDFLQEEDRASLERICDALGVPLSRWQAIPGLRIFQVLAVETFARALQEEGRASREAAVEIACIRLSAGRDGASHERFLRRARAEAEEAPESHPDKMS